MTATDDLFSELRELIEVQFDGRATAVQETRLEHLVSDDPNVMSLYLEYMLDSSLLFLLEETEPPPATAIAQDWRSPGLAAKGEHAAINPTPRDSVLGNSTPLGAPLPPSNSAPSGDTPLGKQFPNLGPLGGFLAAIPWGHVIPFVPLLLMAFFVLGVRHAVTAGPACAAGRRDSHRTAPCD